MTGLKVERVYLTDEAAHRIFATAIEAGHTHGFGYWGKLVEVKRSAPMAHIASVVIQEHEGRIKGDTFEQPIKARLMRAHLERGIVASFNDNDNGVARRIFDDNAIDGPLCELVIQYAMFGKQVYG